MDFLKDLALPQSLSHISLMHFVLVMVLLILMPYLGMLTGGSILSFYFNFKSRKRTDNFYSKIAKDLIELPFRNLYVPVVIGIIPFFASVLIYAQLLQGTKSISVGLMFFAWLVFIAAVVLLYIYKFKLNLKLLLENIEIERNLSSIDELKRFSEDNFNSYSKIGLWGIILLLFSMFILSAGIFNSLDPKTWADTTTIFHIFIQFKVWIRFVHLLTLFFTISGATALYFFHLGNEGISNDDSRGFTIKYFLNFTLVFALLQPIMIFLDIMILPKGSLSIAVFTLAVLSILIVFLVAHFCYVMIKESHTKFAAALFYLMIVAICFLMVKEAYTLKNATSEQSVILAANFKKYEDELKSKLGINLIVLSGEDIFIGKCSACHKFEVNFTGPAFDTVLPKYVDKKNELVKFILSPSKVDPAYPPMPAQGLKPSEAEAITDYLLSTFNSK
jgi:cytochrome c